MAALPPHLARVGGELSTCSSLAISCWCCYGLGRNAGSRFGGIDRKVV